jgi:hypothetical protein
VTAGVAGRQQPGIQRVADVMIQFLRSPRFDVKSMVAVR